MLTIVAFACGRNVAREDTLGRWGRWWRKLFFCVPVTWQRFWSERADGNGERGLCRQNWLLRAPQAPALHSASARLIFLPLPESSGSVCSTIVVVFWTSPYRPGSRDSDLHDLFSQREIEVTRIFVYAILLLLGAWQAGSRTECSQGWIVETQAFVNVKITSYFYM